MSLQARLTKLKEQKELETKKFPLDMFLLLYLKAEHECYIDYMKGLILLRDWIGELDWTDSEETYPDILGGYSLSRLSYLLDIPQDTLIYTFIDLRDIYTGDNT